LIAFETELGKGTTFIIRLPIDGVRGAATAARPRHAATLAGAARIATIASVPRAAAFQGQGYPTRGTTRPATSASTVPAFPPPRRHTAPCRSARHRERVAAATTQRTLGILAKR
jgi:hypothetical protein